MMALVLAIGMAGAGTESPLELRAAVHVHTSFSDGTHTVREVAEMAREAGVGAVVLGDHFMDTIRYGLPGLREAASVRVGVSSLTPRRMGEYLRAAREAERETGVLMLPGVELTPFYYWEGSPLSSDLTLRSGDRHLLVVFPEGADPKGVVSGLPNVASPAGRRWAGGSLVPLWPLLPGLWAVRRLLSPRTRVVRSRHFVIRRRRREWLALSVAALSLAALVRSWPFTVPRFSPYGGEPGLAPYQYALEAAGDTGALTFWAHPEASAAYRHDRYPVRYRSDAYPELVARTDGATGFASLFEGYREAAAPGGFWDSALSDFARGRRERPTWTLGEISLHEQGEAGGKRMGDVETVLDVRERSRAAVLEALANGEGYAVRHAPGSRLVLEEFTVASGDREAGMGGRLVDAGIRRIRVRLRRDGGETEPAPLRIAVLRDGTTLFSETIELTETGTSLDWEDAGPLAGTSYYRLFAEGAYPEMLFGNPVFVSPRGETP